MPASYNYTINVRADTWHSVEKQAREHCKLHSNDPILVMDYVCSQLLYFYLIKSFISSQKVYDSSIQHC